MIAYSLMLFFVQLVAFSNSEDVPEERRGASELLLTFIVHRHGDRTPDPDEIILSEDPEQIRKLSFPEGLSGLTVEGKRRAYQLGKFIRQRYGNEKDGYNLLSDLYVENEIALRSTDLPRTKMTILTLLAALYPPVPDQQWNDNIGMLWQPIPYTAVPSPQDYLRFTANCDRYKALLKKESEVSQDFQDFEDLADVIYKKTGYNFTESPLLYATLHDLFKSQAGLGLTVPEWASPLEPRINKAAKLAFDLYIKSDDMKRLATGVVLNDFLKAATAIVTGESVAQRVHIYTAHDYNVGALMAASNVRVSAIPGYCSMFALELHQSRSTGQYYVLPVYLKEATVAPEAVAMKVRGCGAGLCTFEKFKQISQKHAITEDEYVFYCMSFSGNT